jgi:hypothetical protein
MELPGCQQKNGDCRSLKTIAWCCGLCLIKLLLLGVKQFRLVYWRLLVIFQAEVRAGIIGYLPTPFRPADKADLQQIRLNHVFQRVSFLA